MRAERVDETQAEIVDAGILLGEQLAMAEMLPRRLERPTRIKPHT